MTGQRSRVCGIGAILGLALLTCTFGCSKKEEPAEPVESPPAQGAPHGDDQAAAKPPPLPAAKPSAELALDWKDPSGWERLPSTSSMRKATYRIPAAEGDTEPGELAVFYFGADQGGSVDANMQRWAKQFSGVEDQSIVRSERAVNDLTQHLIEIPSGSYVDSMAAMRGGSADPKANYGLLGAVVEAPTGKYFFKFTGPAKTVKENRAKFYEMLESLRAK